MTIYFDADRAAGLLNKVAAASKSRAIEHVWERLDAARREVYARQREKARAKAKSARRQARIEAEREAAGVGDRRRVPPREEWTVPPDRKRAVVEPSVLSCFKPGIWYRSIEIRKAVPELPTGSVSGFMVQAEKAGWIEVVRGVGVEKKHGPGWGYHLYSITDAGVARLKELLSDEDWAKWEAESYEFLE